MGVVSKVEGSASACSRSERDVYYYMHARARNHSLKNEPACSTKICPSKLMHGKLIGRGGRGMSPVCLPRSISESMDRLFYDKSLLVVSLCVSYWHALHYNYKNKLR